uniref:Prolow-density lipoprotein receptor-related protein 1 (Trinotate prediction) n=1 Tax=Henneguya salminicola TaxID=69463 RepID=A0A6G3MEH1_HENSL
MITFVLFLFSLTQFISQSSQLDVAANLTMIKNYRRFELTIGNLILKESIDKHCGGKLNLRGCTLKSYVNFNQIHDSRDINLNEEYDEVHGIFVFHLIVWNGYKNEDKVFTEQTTLQILLSIQKNTKVEHIYYKKYINLIKAVSNSEKIFDLNLSEYEKFGIYVHYRCLGWIGFNCQFRCDTDKYDIECDYETGIAFCKNQQYLNPPYCNSSDSTCDAKETAMCQNNAICAKTFANTFQCLCPSGFGGKYCQNYNCEPPCDVNFGECIGPNKCKCLVDYKQGQFCNITKCNDISCLNDGYYMFLFYRCM